MQKVLVSFAARTLQNGEWTGATKDRLTQQGSWNLGPVNIPREGGPIGISNFLFVFLSSLRQG